MKARKACRCNIYISIAVCRSNSHSVIHAINFITVYRCGDNMLLSAWVMFYVCLLLFFVVVVFFVFFFVLFFLFFFWGEALEIGGWIVW